MDSLRTDSEVLETYEAVNVQRGFIRLMNQKESESPAQPSTINLCFNAEQQHAQPIFACVLDEAINSYDKKRQAIAKKMSNQFMNGADEEIVHFPNYNKQLPRTGLIRKLIDPARNN